MTSPVLKPEFEYPRSPSAERDSSSIFARNRVLFWVLLAAIFAVGLAVRLYDLSDPPLDFHPTRQLHSALIARGMYYEQRSDVPDWQREMAVNQWHLEGVIEPQVFERLVAWTYGLAGGPDLQVPRLYAIAFWIAGAVFLAWLAAEWIGPAGALVAALFFLVWPYGVVASRAFQPEPLMIALVVAAWWAGARWERRRSWGWAVAAGVLAGLAIYIKTVAVFFVGPAFAVLVLSGGLRRALRSPQVWVMGLLAALPAAIYLVDGVFGRGSLAGQFSLRFFPQMWLDPAFYLRWVSNLGRTVPFETALIALVGALLVRRPAHRLALLAVWAGYFAYGMALPHHISTHDYYHLPLYPAIALGLGAAAEGLFRNLPRPRWLGRAALAAALIAALGMEGYTARTVLKRSDASAQARVWTAIGEQLGPGASVAALVPDYGTGLEYWGWINPAAWPTAADLEWRESIGQGAQIPELFADLAAGKDFFVVSSFDELDRQPELLQLLKARAPVYRQSAEYVIFDLRAARAGK